MSDKPGGAGKGYCDVCSRVHSWGCGHSGSQERDARRHKLTKKHADRECECYGHDHCDPASCEHAGLRTPGYMPFYQHTKKVGCQRHSDCDAEPETTETTETTETETNEPQANA